MIISGSVIAGDTTRRGYIWEMIRMARRQDIQFRDDPDRVFEILAGHWALDRRIVGQASFRGTARFSHAGQSDELAYSETGTLIVSDGREFAASQAYIFRKTVNGFSVYFANAVDRLFHIIDLTSESGIISGSATHHCGNDRYDTIYRFTSTDRFEIRHVVTGPRKDYLSETAFERLA